MNEFILKTGGNGLVILKSFENAKHPDIMKQDRK